MKRPYFALHMVTSIDGKITGKFLNGERGGELCEYYYKVHRQYKENGFQGFICGRVTMQGSFTGEQLPDLTYFSEKDCGDYSDYVAKKYPFYAIAIDPHGKLNWKKGEIEDEDPGYNKSHVIEVLTHDIPKGYTQFLKKKGISYIFCGEHELDCKLICSKLSELFGIEKVLLEGGAITDGLFFNEGVIDELSLTVLPLLDGDNLGKSLFENKNVRLVQEYELVNAQNVGDDVLWLKYVKKACL